jgi:hypothetical protein
MNQESLHILIRHTIHKNNNLFTKVTKKLSKQIKLQNQLISILKITYDIYGERTLSW